MDNILNLLKTENDTVISIVVKIFVVTIVLLSILFLASYLFNTNEHMDNISSMTPTVVSDASSNMSVSMSTASPSIQSSVSSAGSSSMSSGVALRNDYMITINDTPINFELMILKEMTLGNKTFKYFRVGNTYSIMVDDIPIHISSEEPKFEGK